MQLLRIPLLVCATAICVTPLMLHAYDNENQLRARQALEEKMKEMANQPPPAETSAPPVKVVKPEKAPAKKPSKPEAKPKVQPQTPAAPAVTVEKPQSMPAVPAAPVAPAAPEAPAVVFKEPGQPPKEIPPSTAILVTPGEPARPVAPIEANPPAMPAPAAP